MQISHKLIQELVDNSQVQNTKSLKYLCMQSWSSLEGMAGIGEKALLFLLCSHLE